MLVLGLFAFSVALFPPGRPDHGTAAPEADDASGRTGGEPERKEADFTTRKEDVAKSEEKEETVENREAETEEGSAGEITAVVHFSHNGTELTYEGIVELQRFAEQAAAADASWVRIDGYGDSTGTPEANLRVSLRRSEEAAAFLQETMPIDGVDFITAGHGSADPVADNSTVEGRARNRRIEATAGTDAPADRFDRGDSPAAHTGGQWDDVAGVAVPQVQQPSPGAD